MVIMDNCDDLFSPEALRLLEEFFDSNNLLIEPNESSLEVEQPELLIDLPWQTQSKPKHPKSQSVIPGTSTIDFPILTGRKRKRAKFDEKARQKVAAVRKKGSCMRCRILKLPVRTSFKLVLSMLTGTI